MRGRYVRMAPIQGDLGKCDKQKQVMDLSDLVASPMQANDPEERVQLESSHNEVIRTSV